VPGLSFTSVWNTTVVGNVCHIDTTNVSPAALKHNNRGVSQLCTLLTQPGTCPSPAAITQGSQVHADAFTANLAACRLHSQFLNGAITPSTHPKTHEDTACAQTRYDQSAVIT
jgi:hypothetical protein